MEKSVELLLRRRKWRRRARTWNTLTLPHAAWTTTFKTGDAKDIMTALSGHFLTCNRLDIAEKIGMPGRQLGEGAVQALVRQAVIECREHSHALTLPFT